MGSGYGLEPLAETERKLITPSLEEVFRRDYPRLVRAAWLISGSREAAEDLVQDVFAGILAAGHLPNDPGHYIHQAVINRVRSWQRRQSLERRRATEPPPMATQPETFELLGFLRTLSPRQRTAIILRYYCDLPLAEVAELMGCRIGTVTVLVRRALGKARKTKEVFEP